jgi:hypothetical protein
MEKSGIICLALVVLLLFPGCEPSVRLMGSWSDNNQPAARFLRVLVIAIGRDEHKRGMAEKALSDELRQKGYSASGSMEVYGPTPGWGEDSVGLRRLIAGQHFDGALTVRVVSVDEHDRWLMRIGYSGPAGHYQDFYDYYYHVLSYYTGDPGYRVGEERVLLESNLYRTESGALLWSGQSEAFSRDPTPAMAAKYARNVVGDMLNKGVLKP